MIRFREQPDEEEDEEGEDDGDDSEEGDDDDDENNGYSVCCRKNFVAVENIPKLFFSHAEIVLQFVDKGLADLVA